MLRQMGRTDDTLRLHLPSSSSSSSNAIHESLTYLGLDALQKVAMVEIHNPSVRNALSGTMMAELADIVTRLEDPLVHSGLNTVILKGTGGWFSAGADLRVAQKQLTSNEAGTSGRKWRSRRGSQRSFRWSSGGSTATTSSARPS
ncbi:Ethylmalonyl-coa decarboxylase [Globisporangium polare]